MQPLIGADLIAVWEAGQGRHALDRALLLAAVAAPGAGWDELACMAIGARDRLLLQLREATSGAQLPCYVVCPACGAALEFVLRTFELLQDAGGEAGEVALGAYRAYVRAADSLDLAAAVNAGQRARALDAVLERCARVERDGLPVPLPEWPAELVAAITAQLERIDPGAELSLELSCPDCKQAWSSSFDIAEYLWGEVSARAQALLRDVDVLARAYGWSEGEILALSEARRRAYLELAVS